MGRRFVSCSLVFTKGRKLNSIGASVRFSEYKQQKPSLVNLSKKEKVLARNWVIKRKKRL